MKTKILVIDDDPKICRLIKRILIKEDMLVECIASGIVTLPLLKKSSFDVILLDFRLPDMDGFKLLEKIQENRLLKATEVILMTGYGDTEMGMKAMEKGCVDYLPKPFNHEDLVFQIKRAVKKIQFQHKIHKLTESDIIGFEDIIGSSPDMKQIYRLVNRIAGQDTTVLLEGETGTGKNLIARAIYKKSKIKDRLFIPVNCGALTETLMESELFGHEKGAFTGADVKKYGILESAHEGTVFLDEINNASRNVQTKLLQYIETGEIMRVGGNKMIECNSRIIAASNQDLEKLVKENKFREDLYHRLNVIKIVLPPLRSRKGDIIQLVSHFIKLFNKKFHKKVTIDEGAMNILAEYNWPGNIRELKNILQSLLLLNDTGNIRTRDLPDNIKKASPSADIRPFKGAKEELISGFEKDYLDKLLERTRGNVAKASRIAGLNRKNLIEKLKAHHIDPSVYK